MTTAVYELNLSPRYQPCNAPESTTEEVPFSVRAAAVRDQARAAAAASIAEIRRRAEKQVALLRKQHALALAVEQRSAQRSVRRSRVVGALTAIAVTAGAWVAAAMPTPQLAPSAAPYGMHSSYTSPISTAVLPKLQGVAAAVPELEAPSKKISTVKRRVPSRNAPSIAARPKTPAQPVKPVYDCASGDPNDPLNFCL